MASATLEMFIKIVGANKVSRALDNVSDELKDLQQQTEKTDKANAKFAAGMSGLQKTAIAGGVIFAGKQFIDFSRQAVNAAVSAEEAAAAFGTTFGSAAERATRFLEGFAISAGLTVGEAQQLQATLGAVAQGIGFTQEESADLSIELTKIAADVASFSNISAGAEPVLQAFRSALVGEREALKTYGIAITESEVQTKAFLLTSKRTTDELTRQDKALATLALIQDKAAVQIGDLSRTSQSFANQSRAVGAELRSLREEIGAELIPALEILLPKFREIVNNVTPSLISGFAGIANSVVTLVLALDRLDDIDRGFFFLISNMSTLAEEQRFLNEITDRTIDKQNLLAIQTGFTAAQQEKSRQAALKQQVQYKKVSDTIDQFLNPIFGEQNALLLTNIQLEQDRNRLLNLISSANDDVALATQNRNNALKVLEELQIQENLNDANAAIRKAQLQTQIALLTDAQSKGKNVTLELGLATAELAEAEFELLNDSPRLITARENLNIAEQNLEQAVQRQESAIQRRNEELLKSIDLTDKQTDATKKLIDQEDLLRQFMAIERSGIGGFSPTTVTPAPVLTPPSVVQSNNTGGTDITLTTNLILEDEVLATEVQKVNTKMQQRGKTFLVS
tara:strand:- start:1684 stop:3555 length:1872 start_codon:yes stop_codon:yes gene_type:complete